MYGHAPILTSESVYVPTLFFNQGIETTVRGNLMGHIDLYPTLCAAMGVSVPDHVSGYNLLNGAPESRLIFNAKKINSSLFSRDLEFRMWGAWDQHGGHSFSDFGIIGKLLSVANRFTRTDDAAINRRRPLRVLQTCFQRENTFGAPSHGREETKECCDQIWANTTQSTQTTLNESARERLESLGYSEGEIG